MSVPRTVDRYDLVHLDSSIPIYDRIAMALVPDHLESTGIEGQGSLWVPFVKNAFPMKLIPRDSYGLYAISSSRFSA